MTHMPHTPAGISLQEIADLTGGRVTDGHGQVQVTSAAIGSQDVQPGGLFCAVPGTKVHGATYAGGSEAAAVLTDAAGAEIIQTDNPALPIVIVDDVRAWMGDVAAAIYDRPSQKMVVIGITGTSGKTTTSYLVERALMAKHSVGIIGTTGTRINGRAVETKLTTPEAPTMQSLLAQMVDEGVTHVVMEVSSHALELGRVRGIAFDVAAFTNLSQDHLDFHPTMEDYFHAKTLLFTREQCGQRPHAVICTDDEWGKRMLSVAKEFTDTMEISASGDPVGTATRHGYVDGVTVTQDGRQKISAQFSGTGDFEFEIGLAGSFNVANAALALGCVAAAGVDPTEAARHIADLQVPGRMQAIKVGEEQNFLAMVDYAHKPGAVAAILSTLADYLPSAEGRIGIVLGAGGNRDHAKRPMMGEEAAKVAQAVFITDDNPRDEDPAEIRRQVLAGAHTVPAVESVDASLIREIADRAEAIRAAVEWARPGDAIVIAGKGHETGQLVAGTLHEFDDREVLREALTARFTAAGAKAADMNTADLNTADPAPGTAE